MLDPKDFDPTRPLILARAMQVNGHELSQRDTVTVVDDESDEPGALTADQATRLWAGGVLLYADRAVATPVETPEQFAERTTEVDDLGKGKFLIRAPWLGEGEEVSADKLEARRAEIVQLGADGHRELIEGLGPVAAVAVISGTDGFALTDNGNGNFEITGPGLDEPVKVRGKANAEDKVAELRAAAASKVEAESAAAGQTTGGSATVEQPAGDQGGSPLADPAAKTGTQADAVVEPPTV